ncbi:MAG: hypothetical protein GX664_00380 [Bacteroidales bacterium]|nr:hypothetical protein [Bacteroidales bacterium]
MPAFVFIAGVLSHSALLNGGMRKSASNLLTTFVVFTVIYEAVSLILTGDISWYTKNLAPNWLLWFIWSLFLWRLMASIFLKMRVSH